DVRAGGPERRRDQPRVPALTCHSDGLSSRPMKRLVTIALAALALVPALDRLRARRSVVAPAATIVPALTLAVRLPVQAPLASWATVGGCGAGGGSASAPGGGIQWVGRHVTGGLVDAQ